MRWVGQTDNEPSSHHTVLWVRVRTSLKNLKMSDVSKGEAITVLAAKKMKMKISAGSCSPGIVGHKAVCHEQCCGSGSALICRLKIKMYRIEYELF